MHEKYHHVKGVGTISRRKRRSGRRVGGLSRSRAQRGGGGSHTAPGGAELGAPAGGEDAREDGCQNPVVAALDPPPRTHVIQYTPRV